MGFIEIFGTGIGLSMDAFAVAICQGLGMSRINWRHTLIIALFFGGFQALMPFIGWALGSLVAEYIVSIDHWIAFALLVFIGGRMLWEVFHEVDADEDDPKDQKLDIRELLLLAIATSIDALAVGITFAFLDVDIYFAITVIGITTFVLSFAGVAVGNQFGSRFEKPATIIGGVVLILIGVEILLEHLGLLPF